MNLKNVMKCLGMAAVMGLVGCSDDDAGIASDNLNMNVTGLEALGADFQYEGWIIVDGAPVSTGTFTVDANGTPSATTFAVDAADAEAATKFVISVEPIPDSDPAPSAVKVLGGDFDGNTSTLWVGDAAALGTDFTDAEGKYILATPTDGNMDIDEASGVWFLDNSSGMPAQGLTLPTLPAGWAYEGWAVINGTPVSTGTFTSASGFDSGNANSGTLAGPPFPGEDFLTNAPAGLDFPVDLFGMTVVVSVEPVPDNSAAPFLLKPLVAPVATDAATHTALDMTNNAVATNPTGTVTR